MTTTKNPEIQTLDKPTIHEPGAIHESWAELLHQPESWNIKAQIKELLAALNPSDLEKKVEKLKEERRQIELIYGSLSKQSEQNKEYIERGKKLIKETDILLNQIIPIIKTVKKY